MDHSVAVASVVKAVEVQTAMGLDGPVLDVKEVRERAQSCGTLSLTDLGALLDQGGLPGAQQEAKQSKRHRHKSERHAASRRRNDIQQRRGKRGKGPRSPRE